MARRKVTGGMPTLGSAVTSFVIAHPDAETRDRDLDNLQAYLGRRRIPVTKDKLRALVAREVQRLESVENRAVNEARLFSRKGRPRSTRYRHGKPFCPECGMFKDHRKECPLCGHLELTI